MSSHRHLSSYWCGARGTSAWYTQTYTYTRARARIGNFFLDNFSELFTSKQPNIESEIFLRNQSLLCEKKYTQLRQDIKIINYKSIVNKQIIKNSFFSRNESPMYIVQSKVFLALFFFPKIKKKQVIQYFLYKTQPNNFFFKSCSLGFLHHRIPSCNKNFGISQIKVSRSKIEAVNLKNQTIILNFRKALIFTPDLIWPARKPTE